MKIKFIYHSLAFTFALLGYFELFGQTTNKCLTSILDEKKLAANPEISLARKFFDQKLSLQGANKRNDETIHIPVVVHVIHTGGEENISLEQIESQIEVLNQDYQKMAGTPGFGEGANAQISFFLARKDPNGAETNGVNRIINNYTIHDPDFGVLGSTEEQLKSLIQWNPAKYLNIWIVKKIGLGDVLGYANYPDNPDKNLDGVVVCYKNFGNVGAVEAPFNKGRTTTHEIGHWMGLYHPFEGNCEGSTSTDCATKGDRVCDTPQSLQSVSGCPAPSVSCPASGLVLVKNYMDYADDACMNMFTEGQVGRLRDALSTFRSEIFSSQNLKDVGFNLINDVSANNTPDFLIAPYPNPFSCELKIKPNDSLYAGSKFEIISSTGESISIQPITDNNEIQFLTNNLPAGVYFLKITNKNIVFYSKIVKLCAN